jgi:excisionase family DNA binding protein
MKIINGTKFYNVVDLAQMLGVHQQTIRNAAHKGKLRMVRIGHLDHVSEDALNEYLGIKAVQA